MNEAEITVDNQDKSKDSDGELDLDALCDEFEFDAINIADHSSVNAAKSNHHVKSDKHASQKAGQSNASSEDIRLQFDQGHDFSRIRDRATERMKSREQLMKSMERIGNELDQ